MVMLNCRPNFYLLILAMLCSFYGCSSTVEVPKTNSSLSSQSSSQTQQLTGNELPKNSEAQIDLAQEAMIEQKCLEAWRLCIAGKKEEGLAQFKKLGQQYPKSASVLLMTGQALERCGYKSEAISYYEKAANKSDFAIMSSFKLAESLRTTGKTTKAITQYKKLISISPQFAEAHLGLAKALKKLNSKSQESTI